ncbi:MAG: hypothetical protein R2712_05070 [Vicinamibacterales bacterium]
MLIAPRRRTARPGRAAHHLSAALAARMPGEIHVACGFAGTPAPALPHGHWIDAPDGLAGELARASVAIVAGGVTLYEACALGVPVVGLAVTAAQHQTVRSRPPRRGRRWWRAAVRRRAVPRGGGHRGTPAGRRHAPPPAVAPRARAHRRTGRPARRGTAPCDGPVPRGTPGPTGGAPCGLTRAPSSSTSTTRSTRTGSSS